jgi:hypothetical protein
MLQTKPTDTSTTPSEGISAKEPFDILKLGKEMFSLGEVFKSNFELIGDAFDSFVKDFNAMETAATNLATSFGGMRGLTASIKENIAGATSSVIELGGSLEDVAKIQQGIVKGLQTQTILNEDAYAELYAVSNLVSDGTKQSADISKEMVTTFMNAGYGLYDVSNQVLGIINESRELGVTTAAVYNQISANIGRLALFNFEKGVQGMAEMAAKAASLRIDMKSTLDFADKLFNPEKAIEVAAAMQRLGVNVASLLDPYKLMDMARNDPAKLQEEILKATQSLTYFDEKNKKMAILPGAQQTIRELSTALDIPLDQLTKMALNAGDLDRKLREIKFSPDFAGDEEARNMIANMAQLKGDKYVVTFDEMNKQTGQIESVTKEVSELTKDNKEALLKMNEPAKTAIELQREANNSLVNINNSIRALRGVVPRYAAASSVLTKAQKTAEKTFMPAIRGAGTVFGANMTDKGLSTKVAKKNVNAVMNTLDDVFTQVVTGKKSFSDAISTLGTLTKSALNLNDIFLTAIKGYNKEALKQGGKEIDVNAVSKYVYPIIEGIENTVGLNKSVPSRDNVTVNTPKYSTDKNIKQQVTQSNVESQNQGIANEFKSTIDINLNVNPADMKSLVMDYLKSEAIGKELVNIYKNRFNENNALIGNTSSAKNNIR